MTTYNIELTDIEAQRIEEAARQGVDFPNLVRKLIATLPDKEQQRPAPVQVFDTGMTEEEEIEFCNDFVHRVVRGGERQPDGTMKYK